METQIWRKRGQAGFRLVSGHSVFIPRLGLLITFVRATIPQTLHAAILFSCLCFYDFPKRTAPKIHKIWHLVNLINVRWPFAKKKKRRKLKTALWHFCGECFLWDLDDPICWTWMLYAGCVLSFFVTIRIPPTAPAGAELSFGGAAAPIQPTYTLIRIFGKTGTQHQPGHTLTILEGAQETFSKGFAGKC